MVLLKVFDQSWEGCGVFAAEGAFEERSSHPVKASIILMNQERFEISKQASTLRTWNRGLVFHPVYDAVHDKFALVGQDQFADVTLV